MKILNSSEVQAVSGGELTWDEGKNIIGGLALVGLCVGTGGAGLFGVAVWIALSAAD